MAAGAGDGARQGACSSGVEPIGLTTLRLFGIPESEIAKTLREIEEDTDLSDLEITTCLRRAELHIDIRHRPGSEDALAALTEGIVGRHERFLFSDDGSSIDDQVAELLRDGHRIGLGESCTAGLLAARLTEPPGASAVPRRRRGRLLERGEDRAPRRAR